MDEHGRWFVDDDVVFRVLENGEIRAIGDAFAFQFNDCRSGLRDWLTDLHWPEFRLLG